MHRGYLRDDRIKSLLPRLHSSIQSIIIQVYHEDASIPSLPQNSPSNNHNQRAQTRASKTLPSTPLSTILFPTF